MNDERERDEHGRASYAVNEVPPTTEHFAFWRGRLTHYSAVHTPSERDHDRLCIGGWIPSGEWWLHCGRCRGEAPEESMRDRVARIVGEVACGGTISFPFPSDYEVADRLIQANLIKGVVPISALQEELDRYRREHAEQEARAEPSTYHYKADGKLVTVDDILNPRGDSPAEETT